MPPARERLARVWFITLTALPACSLQPREPAESPPILLSAIPVHYNNQQAISTIALSPEQQDQLRAIFQPAPETAQAERLCIRKAIAWFERVAGEQLPTCCDLREDKVSEFGSGLQDCRDEAHTTTTYLLVLQQQRLIPRHRVLRKAYRGPLNFDTHWTAQMIDVEANQPYVVDSWYRHNAYPPIVQKTGDWIHRKPWPEDENPDKPDPAHEPPLTMPTRAARENRP